MSESPGSGLGPQRRYVPTYEDDETADQQCSSMWDMAQSSQDSMIWSDSSQNTVSSHSSLASDRLQRAGPSDKLVGKEIQLQHWSKLADAALRTTIGGSSTVRTDGVRLSSDSGGTKLAEIAPSIFSPFYAAVGAHFVTYEAAKS